MNPRQAWRLLASCVLPGLGLGFAATAAAAKNVPADDPALQCSDFVAREVLPDHAVRFHRILDVPGRGYRWDNPGARVRFRTDARAITVRLRYSDKHTSPSARAPVGIFLVDGRGDPAWTFSTRQQATLRAEEAVAVELPVPPAIGFHDYAIVLPYGDSVDLLGLTVSDRAAFAAPAPRPPVRYVAYGDSITHGFTASHIGHTYAFLLAEAKQWELVDLGLGGRAACPPDAEVVGAMNGDIVTVLIGGNDWQLGIAPEAYRQAMRTLLTRLRTLAPHVPIYALTPLWVSAQWKPEKARFPLEAYRAALRTLVGELHDSDLHLVEGPDLIDHDERYFDPILVHPNDAGFDQMARRLAARIGPLRGH